MSDVTFDDKIIISHYVNDYFYHAGFII